MLPTWCLQVPLQTASQALCNCRKEHADTGNEEELRALAQQYKITQ